VRETRMLRSTWRGLETWFGRELRPISARQSPTLLMSGEGKRDAYQRGTAPFLDSTTNSCIGAANQR
jgi:hypothetical protein